MRDIRKRGWFWIENELIDRTDLSFEVKSMYMILARFADNEGKCFPSIEKLAEIIGKDKRTVIRYIKKLEEKGLIEKRRRFNQTNIYYLKNADSNSDKIDNDKNDSDKDVTSLGDTGVTYNSDKNVNLKRPIEKDPIKNTQYKEKYKKEKLNNIECYVMSLEKDENYKQLLFKFIKYRKEIRKSLKTISPLKALIKEFPLYSDLKEALEIMETREWRTATAEWVENYKNSLGGNNNGNSKSWRNSSQKVADKHNVKVDRTNDGW